jgi:hypothetical protein
MVTGEERMSKESFMVVEKVYHVETGKLDSRENKFTLDVYGHTTKGASRKVRIVLGAWILPYFAGDLAGIPGQIRRLADDIDRALRSEGK